MILTLASRHPKKIASLLLLLFYSSLLVPAMAGYRNSGLEPRRIDPEFRNRFPIQNEIYGSRNNKTSGNVIHATQKNRSVPAKLTDKPAEKDSTKEDYTGGPSQPEMSSFRAIGTDKMVNLFTGDFSYNIPLMDVGGYPVNIYYDAGITPEQEASWVGLGWNINPGNINRNTRGTPDDFNGLDTLEQVQKMKPNKTWGLGIGTDAEAVGIKLPIHMETGVAFNNYLGPSLERSIRGILAYKILKIAGSEKFSAEANLSIGIEMNSRAGTSFPTNVSLLGRAKIIDGKATAGLGLATGYNSRSGIKALTIYEQHSFSNAEVRKLTETTSTGSTSKEYNYGGRKTGINKLNTTISFAKPSYTPSLRMPLTNTAWSGHFQLGTGSMGFAADIEAEVYGQKSEIASTDVVQLKPMVGYLYFENATNNPDYVMDFTRFNDREVTPNTPVISVPQYTYDVFSIQGEGTGGSIRAYRNDLGYVRDNSTISKDKNLSVGADVDPPGHFGANFNLVKTPSAIGEWKNGNKLRNAIAFTKASGSFENVYFRNPGESSVVDPNRLAQIGGIDLVRFVIDGPSRAPSVEAKLQTYDKALKEGSPVIDLTTMPVITERNKRTQLTSFLTAAEAAIVGLDKVIKSYDNQDFLDLSMDTLEYESIPRVGGIRKGHHISQINVTEESGRRYVYGIPVYNIKQKDFTFSVDNSYSDIPEKVLVNSNLSSSASVLLDDNSSRDGYVQITTTPANAHSFLLSGILSADYVDVTGNGITEDDLGDAVKFNYARIKNGANLVHRWRVPFSENDSANFYAGLRSELKDDKAMISYGERESWYLQSIESKTMIAFFYVSNRLDGKGAIDENGGINASENLIKKLDSIALFSKADIKARHLSGAKPIKTVHFLYSYLLCQNTPDNASTTSGSKGKLTLQGIYSTYNGKTREFKNKYSFQYNTTGSDNPADNPDYQSGAADRWGTYKPSDPNPGGLKNMDYPYSLQASGSTAVINQQASAWSLKKIVLPSGGQIEVDYESDDYAFVQDKRAAVMMQVVGFGYNNSYNQSSDRLYSFVSPYTMESDYVFIQVPVACSNAADVYTKYLQGVTQLAFKIWVNMPKGYEFIPCYASFNANDYGVDGSNPNIIWIKMKRIANKNPLSLTALEFLRQQLPGQAFKGYDIAGEPPLKQVGDMLLGMLTSLRFAFTDPVNALRKEGKAMNTDLSRCFVRLNDPDGIKYGGGHRVKSVMLKDNWNAMTGQFTSTYGQKYEYTTTENFNGAIRTISSGVASYEPSIGGEENPHQSILEVADYLPLGPTSFGAVEMPVLDAFFPAPLVGYSKVTVRSIRIDTATAKKTRSGIGKQVTEYYTAKDYPVYYSYTPLDASSTKEFHQSSVFAFFNKYVYDYKAHSQGFLVVTNDMHGKIKSQSSYAENDTATRINYTENFYRNTGRNGANDLFTFVSKENGGTAYQGNMGIDVELMTDTREFSVKGTSVEAQAQVDIFYFVTPIPFPTIWTVNGIAENIYRSVTTTKLVSFRGVLDSILVIDKGSQVSTKNFAFDAETGEVLITRTNNEFNKPIYNTSYPAHWAYSGMGLGYKNIDARFSGINFSDGRITNAGFDLSVFESGDEILIKSASVPESGCDQKLASGVQELVWAFDINKNITSLNTSPDFVFIDARGVPYTMNNVSLRIIRSGKRNMLDAKAATITSMVNPLLSGKLFFDTSYRVINASAVEYKERWITDNDVIRRLKLVKDPVTCVISEVEDSTGYLEKNINPYRKGLLGNFRVYRNMVFYDSRSEYDSTANTNIGMNGFLKDFKPYWDINLSNNLVPDSLSTQWVWNSRLNKTNAKGLELETQNALNIYTAAQYGYNKTMPVAMVNNSRYHEMFGENFEDYGYGESISHAQFNYLKRHIDFRKLSNSSLVNTDTMSFNAHSGKYAIGVNSGAAASFDIPVDQPANTYPPALLFGKDTTRMLHNLGGNYGFTSIVPLVTSPSDRGTPSYGNSTFSMQIYPKDSLYAGGNRGHYYSFYDTFYIEITDANTYNFAMSLNTAYNNTGVTVFAHNHGMGVAIYDEMGTIVSDYTLGQSGFQYTSANYSVFLCPGVYKIIASGTELYQATDNGLNYTSNNYTWVCSNSSAPDYKDLSTVDGCIFTKPIAAVDSMLNPLFSIPKDKKMLFSGWVRETCGDTTGSFPCKEHTYTHSQVQLSFAGYAGSNVILKPAGPIIDGWQRIEGSFVAPAGAESMSLSIVNSGTGKLYLDDIRIHPYNANMRSYVYDPVNLRLVAELDENNYGSFYEYDEEGLLIRTKVETREGIKTVTETRTSLQKVIQ